MWSLDISVTDAIRRRYSCRAYDGRPIAAEQASQLVDVAASTTVGRLGTPLRIALAAATAEDPQALKGLGTYGLIKDPVAFLVGVVSPGLKNLEEYGYALETVVLHATGLGLDTCWLGGNFTRSSFSRRIAASGQEIVPAVASVGYAVEGIRDRDRLRRQVRSDTRLPWDLLFFDEDLARPLSKEAAGAYALPLDMLRLAPSGRNYQPWRVVRDGARFHFYLQRTRGYGRGGLYFTVMGTADLPRVELGIAMCHFELTAQELGLAGEWTVQDPAPSLPADGVEYVVTWEQSLAAGA